MNLMEPGIRLCYSGQAVIMALIVCGGLGFGIYKEINSRLANRFFSKHRRLHMQWTPYFKLVMISTGILLAGGALAIFAVSSPHAAEPLGEHLWICLSTASRHARRDSISATTAAICPQPASLCAV